MSHFGPGGQQGQFAQTDMYNQQYNQHSDTELINLISMRLICSVFGYLCCACTGICAMYYAIRANHAVDWERDPELVRDHTKKAKCLTLTSITIGTILFLIAAIVTIVMIVNLTKTVEAASDYSSSFNYNYNH